MSLSRYKLLLAGIPAGAILISLLWLKRRHSKQVLHHTDPGGSSSKSSSSDPIIKKEKKVQLIDEKESDNILKSSSVIIDDKIINNKEDNNKLLETELPENSINNITLVEEKEIVENCCYKIEKISVTSVPSNSIEISKCRLIDAKLSEDLAKNYIETKLAESPIGSITADIGEESLLETTFSDSISSCTENSLQFEIDSIESVEKIDNKEIVVEINIGEKEEETLLENTIEGIEEIITEEPETEVLEVDPEKSSIVVVNNIEESKNSCSINVEDKEDIVEEKEEEGAKANIMKTPPTQLAEKLASLELDTMKLREESGDKEQKGCSERDSANHSPSEVMLASPSISNFSDAHSEGSSDSGKGHSDVATSPSRTPAGGSSLAGDLAPSIYEFVLPQIIVGRLIGRRGSYLHEIRTSTQTNIYIKKHPETNKLKICAIEGTQQDIDKALTKIRQKFPLRRFPQLTLEKVPFVTLSPPPLKLEDCNLQLVQGVNNDVILSSLITAAHFFLQQPSHHTYGSLAALNHIMNQIYTSGEAPMLEPLIKDAVCAAPTMGGWYRAQIVDLNEETGTSTVRFLDYGGYLTLDSNCLRQIRGDLLSLPFQAVECYLANVIPAGENGWTEEARIFVHNLTLGQILQAQIYDYAEDGTPLVYLYASYGSQVILINEELVMKGYGVLTNTPLSSSTPTIQE